MTTRNEREVAQMYRHTALVAAVHEAIEMLEASFGPDDYVPGAIEDAIEILRGALKAGDNA